MGRPITYESGFFILIRRGNEKSIEYSGKTYTKDGIFPKATTIEEFAALLGRLPTLNLSALTTDQQIYRPKDQINIMIASLQHANSKCHLEIKRNGILWLEDEIDLDKNGLALYTLYEADIGEYQVEGLVNVDKNGKTISIGTTTFDVAAFELDPLNIRILRQTISKKQLLTVDLEVKILNASYSGKLKVGLYCSSCREIVSEDEIVCSEGKGIVSFNVGNHRAPFSLHFRLPDLGYTAQILLEGTMPSERTPIPLSYNLLQNYSMLLFPESNSTEVAGINIVPGDYIPDAAYAINHVVGNPIQITFEEDLNEVCLITLNFQTNQIKIVTKKNVKKGDSVPITPSAPVTLVLIGGCTDNILEEAYFMAFTPISDLLTLNTPDKIESGKKLSFSVRNHTDQSINGFLLVYDQRKTHTSLYKALGKQLDEYLYEFYEQLDDTFMFFTEEDMSLSSPSLSSPGPRRAKHPDPKLAMAYSAMQPFSPDIQMAAAPPDMELKSELSADTAVPPFRQLTVDTLEDFPEVLYCEKIELNPHETRTIELDAGDQITTWVVRLYSFNGLEFKEDIKYVNAVRERYLEIRAPAIIDTENNDSAEVEIRCLTDVKGKLTVFFNNKELIKDKLVPAGQSSTFVTVNADGLLQAVLTTEKGIIETEKEISKPFEQTLMYWNVIHLFPEEAFSPPQEVTIYPTPLILLEDVVNSLLQYPYGCAEQTSSKIGGLAILYKYLKLRKDQEISKTEKLIKQGLERMKRVFYNEEKQLFGLWDKTDPNIDVTVQVLRNLVPLNEILDSLPVSNTIKAMIHDSVQALIKNGRKSPDLIPYSEEFKPKDMQSTDVLEAAKNLIYLKHASERDKKSWLEVIRNSVQTSKDKCWWFSEKAWGGKLETTAIVLRALINNIDLLDPDLKELYKHGLAYINSFLINGRLFSTSDTFALVNLFSDIQITSPVIVLENGEEVAIKDKVTVNQPFTAKSHLLITWVQEVLANPFETLPKNTLKADVSVSKHDLELGESFKVTVTVADEVFCPVLALCLPPHLALQRGGGNVQQHYLAFEGRKMLTLDIVTIRKGTGHIRIVVHEMYNNEMAKQMEPIAITVK